MLILSKIMLILSKTKLILSKTKLILSKTKLILSDIYTICMHPYGWRWLFMVVCHGNHDWLKRGSQMTS